MAKTLDEANAAANDAAVENPGIKNEEEAKITSDSMPAPRDADEEGAIPSTIGATSEKEQEKTAKVIEQLPAYRSDSAAAPASVFPGSGEKDHHYPVQRPQSLGPEHDGKRSSGSTGSLGGPSTSPRDKERARNADAAKANATKYAATQRARAEGWRAVDPDLKPFDEDFVNLRTETGKSGVDHYAEYQDYQDQHPQQDTLPGLGRHEIGTPRNFRAGQTYAHDTPDLPKAVGGELEGAVPVGLGGRFAQYKGNHVFVSHPDLPQGGMVHPHDVPDDATVHVVGPTASMSAHPGVLDEVKAFTQVGPKTSAWQNAQRAADSLQRAKEQVEATTSDRDPTVDDVRQVLGAARGNSRSSIFSAYAPSTERTYEDVPLPRAPKSEDDIPVDKYVRHPEHDAHGNPVLDEDGDPVFGDLEHVLPPEDPKQTYDPAKIPAQPWKGERTELAGRPAVQGMQGNEILATRADVVGTNPEGRPIRASGQTTDPGGQYETARIPHPNLSHPDPRVRARAEAARDAHIAAGGDGMVDAKVFTPDTLKPATEHGATLPADPEPPSPEDYPNRPGQENNARILDQLVSGEIQRTTGQTVGRQSSPEEIQAAAQAARDHAAQVQSGDASIPDTVTGQTALPEDHDKRRVTRAFGEVAATEGAHDQPEGKPWEPQGPFARGEGQRSFEFTQRAEGPVTAEGARPSGRTETYYMVDPGSAQGGPAQPRIPSTVVPVGQFVSVGGSQLGNAGFGRQAIFDPLAPETAPTPRVVNHPHQPTARTLSSTPSVDSDGKYKEARDENLAEVEKDAQRLAGGNIVVNVNRNAPRVTFGEAPAAVRSFDAQVDAAESRLGNFSSAATIAKNDREFQAEKDTQDLMGAKKGFSRGTR